MYDRQTTRKLGEEVRGYPSATTSIEARLRKMREQANTTDRVNLTMTVQKQQPVAEHIARVLFQVGGEVTEANVEAAVSESFEDKVRYLANSAHYPHSENRSLVGAFVQMNAPSKPYDTAGLQGMSAVVANVFRDADDAIWKAVGEGDNRLLVQVTQDDLSTLLSHRNSHSIATASTEVAMGEVFASGEGVMWYDLASESYHTGISVSDKLVFDFDKKHQSNFVAVSPAMVVIAAETPLDIAREVAFNPPILTDDKAPITPDNMIARHLEYMGTLYANTPYFSRLQSLLSGTFKNGMAIQ